MKLEALSWNIWYGTYLDKATAFIKNFNADIVGLQEVTQTPEGTNNLAEQLSRSLGYEYAYANGADARNWGKSFFIGNALLSKYPIVMQKTHILSKENSRTAIRADITVEGKLLHVFSTHLLHTHQKPSAVREEQARTLVSVIPKDHSIVMGDFNAIPESATIQIMRKALRQVDGDSTSPTWSMYPEGCKECNPKGLNVRLDYMFATNDIRTSNFAIEQSDGSDHLPISADIEV